MASKSTRILILLAIDTLFFLIELITGYIVGSLALVADSYHMLNDVLSLLVGLWAVKVANTRSSSKQFTYGWQRAETLGALVNGVFLVALCVTIFLEAIERFTDVKEVTQPKIILIVGSVGLASNLLGLVLFHDHSHGGGGHGHSHGGHSHGDVEAGTAQTDGDAAQRQVASQSGNIEDVLPSTRVAGFKSTDTAGSDTTAVEPSSLNHQATMSSQSGKQRRHSRTQSRVFSGPEDIPVTPTAFRKSIIEASKMDRYDEEDEEEDEEEAVVEPAAGPADNQQPLLNGAKKNHYGATHRKSIDHKDHMHTKPKEAGKGGHSHGDLNMRGIFLHVMGDALGNIGVIATALFIWQTDFSWRYYVDPAISLVIAIIILCSAIPLCKAASRILLQATPPGIDLDHIKADIEDLPGIVSCHEVHVWQLSESKLVSSLHVQVDFNFKGEGSARYMELAQAIRKCLHEYGIHSSTIQPEFCLDPDHNHEGQAQSQDDGVSPPGSTKRLSPGSRVPSKAGSLCEQSCLLECTDNSCRGKGCCAKKADGQVDDTMHGHAH